ncbi:MAG: gliding motility protein GldN [Porphyromonadaceae bacterium]|nr:gliding motility protein GldN [Porphyromonadaceae bacterium]
MMKIKVRHIVILLGLCTMLPICEAQNTVIRRSSEVGNKSEKNGLSVRAQSLYQNEGDTEADVPWSRGIYRQIDLTQEENLPLYYPEEIVNGQENLFRVLLGLVASNQIKVYEYLDGREIFTEEYEVNVEEMLDRFHILYEVKAGRTAKRNTYIIEESDVPCNEVLSYYVKERWIFDQRNSCTYPVIEAICPVLHRVGDFGGEAVRYPMFWAKYEDIQPFLAQHYIFTSNLNNIQNYTYEDFFKLRLFKGDIYKTQNLRNMSLVQLYATPEAQDSARQAIEQQLRQFDKSLWVAEEETTSSRAKKKAETPAVEEKGTETKPADKTVTASTRSSRGSSSTSKSSSSSTKTTKSKSSTSSSRSSSSAPTYSVRRTR